MEKLYGQWFKGDVYSMRLKEFQKIKKYDKGIKKPTALETKEIKGIVYSRFYYKPQQPGEFWD